MVLCMNDRMKLYRSLQNVVNQRDAHEGKKLSFIRNYTDYVEFMRKMKHNE
jgi:hypothetical protein